MVFAFAPIVGLLLGLSADHGAVGHAAALGRALHRRPGRSLAQVLRRSVLSRGGEPAPAARCCARLQPLSLVALLATLVLLFGFQGEQILAQPLIIAMLAVPILIQVYFNSGLRLPAQPRAGEAHCVAAPVGADRREQLLRAGGRRRHQPVRLRLGRGARHRRRRADRSAGDAVGREDRQYEQAVVRSGACGQASGRGGRLVVLGIVLRFSPSQAPAPRERAGDSPRPSEPRTVPSPRQTPPRDPHSRSYRSSLLPGRFSPPSSPWS